MKSVEHAVVDDRKMLSISMWMAGCLVIVTGIAAIVAPLTAALAVDILVGILLLLAGLSELFFAWSVRSAKGSAWRMFRAACFVCAGIVLLLLPRQGIVTLALVLGCLFLLEGILRLLLVPQLPGGNKFVLMDGVLGILLGFVILMGWPGDSAWIIGILVGVRLIMSGLVLLWIGSVFQPRSGEQLSSKE